MVMGMFDWARKTPKNGGFRGVSMPFEAVTELDAPDYRGLPTFRCICGYNMVIMCAVFDEETRAPGMYLLDGRCAACGAWLTLPTEVDHYV
jgi:hypothetical protein